jgi:hypothetical protein
MNQAKVMALLCLILTFASAEYPRKIKRQVSRLETGKVRLCSNKIRRSLMFLLCHTKPWKMPCATTEGLLLSV